jgi:hypothetical protein
MNACAVPVDDDGTRDEHVERRAMLPEPLATLRLALRRPDAIP